MSVSSVCFIVPTYNEAANIASMVGQLLALCDTHPERAARVLVVDDESPDGTGEIVLDLKRRDDRVHLLSGPKRGLGHAYIRAYKHVLAEFDVDAVVQIDADFSHAPTDAPRLLSALEGVDVVIGSRYVAGGEVDRRWGPLRRMLSGTGNLCARYIAGIYHVRDCTGGFRAIRVSALRRAFPLRLKVQGYVFQVAMLHALMISGARIAEVPIRFTDRAAGVTKLGRRDVAEFFVHVWWLRLLSKKTFVKFALTGLSGVVVNLLTFQALLGFALNPYLCSAVAVEISIVWNFLLNNYWTFRDRSIRARKRIRGLKFNLISVLTLAVSFATFVTLRWLLPHQPEVTAQAISILPAVLANYFANSYWTFRRDEV